MGVSANKKLIEKLKNDKEAALERIMNPTQYADESDNNFERRKHIQGIIERLNTSLPAADRLLLKKQFTNLRKLMVDDL